MIKWDGFGKLLKQLSFGLLISCFILLGNFSDAKVQDVGLLKYPSTVDQNFSIGFLKGGGVLTDFLGTTKSVVALDTNTIFWWATNGMPYFYSEGVNTIQGFFDRYFSCDALTTIDTLPENCQLGGIIDYSGGLQSVQEIFKGFFSKVYQDDLAYYNYINNRYVGATLSYTEQGLEICWSSEEIGKSLCFRGGTCGASSSSHCNGFLGGGQLTNSQNLSNLSFGNVSNNWIGYAPGQVGYGGNFEGSSEGSSQGVINSNLTGDYIYSDCTYKDILIALESEGYNQYVCYGGIDNFNLYDSSLSYNPIAGRGLSLNQIWAWSGSRAWDTFPEWFIFWNGLYVDTTENNYNAMWESYPAVYYTFFKIYNSYAGGVLDPRTLLEYCQLRTLTGDSLNASVGGYFKPACETIVREKQTGIWESRIDGTLYSTGVGIGVNWNGVGNMSGLETQGDGLAFIQNFFNLAKSKITTNYSNSYIGFIPNYIIVFLLAIILFRFLRH